MRVEGVVVAQRPGGLYDVAIEATRRITAHAAAGTDRNFMRLLVGDRVLVELMPRDRTRGRIVRAVNRSQKSEDRSQEG